MSDPAIPTPSVHGAPTIRVIAMPADANPAGDIFGGWLMGQMDLAAATIATRRAMGRTATVAVDGMSFISPVSVGDEVSLFAEVLQVGRTSIRVAVQAWRRRRDSSEASPVTTGTFVYVAIDDQRKPRPVAA